MLNATIRRLRPVAGSDLAPIRTRTIHGYERAFRMADSGPAVLLLHGIGDDSITRRDVMPDLSRDHLVIAPDLLGHGASDEPRGDYSIGGFANGCGTPLWPRCDVLVVVSHPWGTISAMRTTRTRALRVRLGPNDVQAGLLLRRSGARRVGYNFVVEVLRRNGETWRRQAEAGVPRAGRVKVPSHFDLIRRWTGADGMPAARDLICRDRTTGETWWHQHPAKLFEAALKDARENYGKHLRGEARPPKFLALRRDVPRFRSARRVVLEPGRLRFEGLPRGMWLRVAHTCPGQAKLCRLVRRGRAAIKSVTVKRDRLGRWWATITTSGRWPSRRIRRSPRPTPRTKVQARRPARPSGSISGSKPSRSPQPRTAHSCPKPRRPAGTPRSCGNWHGHNGSQGRDVRGRAAARATGPPLIQDLRSLWGSETRTVPRRTHLHVRDVWSHRRS